MDLVPDMIATARTLHSNIHGVRFTLRGEKTPETDFAVFNGIFHVRQEEHTQSWEAYARATLHRVWQTTPQGMAFNVLSTYSDAERRRRHLHYGSPEDWFGWCVATFGRHVALLHDYGLHEFTLLVRKAPSSEEVSRQPPVDPGFKLNFSCTFDFHAPIERLLADNARQTASPIPDARDSRHLAYLPP